MLANYLSNERTMLAWLRTSMASATLGIALIKTVTGRTAAVAGILFLALACYTAILGTGMHWVNYARLKEGVYRPNKFLAFSIGLVTGMLTIIAMAGIILEVHPLLLTE